MREKASRGWQQRRHRSVVPYRRPGRREGCAITLWPSARRLFFSSVASSSCCAALISAVTSTFGRSAEEAIVGALLEICGAASSLSSGSSLASPARRLVRAGSSRRGCEMPLAGRICFSSFLARLGFSGCQFLFEAVAEVLPFRVGLFDNCARRPANLFLLGVQWGRRDVC